MQSTVLLVLLVVGISSSLICPDGKVCPDNCTCCETKNGYQCCPYPNATCCPDRLHCCPHGYRCNMQTQECERPGGRGGVPMLRKTAAEKPSAGLKPGAPLVDPELTEQDDCCRSRSGCCPEGFRCGEHKTCVSDGTWSPVTELKQARSVQASDGVILCNQDFFCPSGNTCCRTPNGQWACCPYPLGQCCLDGKHCCEYGYSCDSTSKNCKNGYIYIPSGLKEKARRN